MNKQVLEKIWNKDPSAWKGDPSTIRQRLGWIDCVQEFSAKAKSIESFAKSIPYSNVVLLGMGGSSLVSRVFSECFSHPTRNFYVIDTTDTATILSIQNKLPLHDTLFIVASKSGTTLEVRALCDHFFSLCPHPEQFIAITDFNTPLMRHAEEKKFRHIFVNPSDIGGRFSALSYFGLVPFALMGGHVEDLLACAKEAIRLCQQTSSNPAAYIAKFIFANAQEGRDKLTFLTVPSLRSFPKWIEQLIGESTGKDQKGICPVIEDLPTFEGWNQKDRTFVVFTTSCEHIDIESKISRPVISRTIKKTDELGLEFFIWEFATALLGNLLEINPFDEPNVVFSKKKTSGYLRDPSGIDLKISEVTSPSSVISDFIKNTRIPEYIAILSYLPESNDYPYQLKNRMGKLELSTIVSHGPGYLHSTGQFHKGGPNSGRFILLIDDQPEVLIPGQNYGFQTLKLAQALGDFEALKEANRKVIMVKI